MTGETDDSVRIDDSEACMIFAVSPLINRKKKASDRTIVVMRRLRKMFFNLQILELSVVNAHTVHGGFCKGGMAQLITNDVNTCKRMGNR